MNLLFNKGVLDNTAKVFDIFLRPTHKPTETQIKVYSDALNGDNHVNVPAQYMIFGGASLITVLDKINSAMWNETFNLAQDGERVKILTGTILNGTESQRNSALDKLVSMGILAAGDIPLVKSLSSRVPTFDPALMIRSFDQSSPANPFYKYSYNIPLGLEKKYSSTRNTSNEKLYLIFVGRGHSQFGYAPVTGEDFGYFTKYWNNLFQKDSFALGYLAVDLGDIMSPDQEAIKYDYLNEIEYFDNIIIQIELPNQYTTSV